MAPHKTSLMYAEQYEKHGMEIRTFILFSSLQLESVLSIMLMRILEITPPSKIFGAHSMNISFNQKVQLMLELREFAKEDPEPFQRFMEIRNLFTHNLDINTYEDCFRVLDSRDKRIRKELLNKARAYHQAEAVAEYDARSAEDQLEEGVHHLVDGCLNKAQTVADRMLERVEEDVLTDIFGGLRWDHFRATLSPVVGAIKRLRSAPQDTYTKKEVEAMLATAASEIRDVTMKAFKEQAERVSEKYDSISPPEPSTSAPTPPSTDPPDQG